MNCVAGLGHAFSRDGSLVQCHCQAFKVGGEAAVFVTPDRGLFLERQVVVVVVRESIDRDRSSRSRCEKKLRAWRDVVLIE